MATDLHIHIDAGLTQEDYHCIFSSQDGSVYLKYGYTQCQKAPKDSDHR